MSRNRQPVGEGPGLGAGPGRGEGGSQWRGGERSEPPRNGDPPSPRLMRQGEDSFVQTGRRECRLGHWGAAFDWPSFFGQERVFYGDDLLFSLDALPRVG